MFKSPITRLFKGSLIYGIAGILNRFMGLLLLPFYTSTLSLEDYGITALISLVGISMSGIISLGTGNSMGLLYYQEKNLIKRPAVIWTNILLMAVNGIFLFTL